MLIKKFTTGWNNSVYLGEFDSNYDHIIKTILDFSVDYAYFSLNFNIILIEPSQNFTLNETNFFVGYIYNSNVNQTFNNYQKMGISIIKNGEIIKNK